MKERAVVPHEGNRSKTFGGTHVDLSKNALLKRAAWIFHIIDLNSVITTYSVVKCMRVRRLAALLRGALFHPSGQALPVSGPGVGMVLTEPEQESKTKNEKNKLKPIIESLFDPMRQTRRSDRLLCKDLSYQRRLL